MTSNNHSYYYSLELEGINCFKEKQTLDLSDGNGNYSPWTIILGDNGTGKTTLLKVLDRMQLEIYYLNQNSDESKDKYAPLILSNKFFKSLDFRIELKIKNHEQSIDVNTIVSDVYREYTNFSEKLFFLLSYGASRRMSKKPYISQNEENPNMITSLFDESLELINAEEWFLQKRNDFAKSK